MCNVTREDKVKYFNLACNTQSQGELLLFWRGQYQELVRIRTHHSIKRLVQGGTFLVRNVPIPLICGQQLGLVGVSVGNLYLTSEVNVVSNTVL